MNVTVKLAHVREQVEADDHAKWDAVLPMEEISLEQGRLTFPQAYAGYNPNALAPTPWATAQMCGQLGIPTAYFRRCPPHLQDIQFNHWCSHRGPEPPTDQNGKPEAIQQRDRGVAGCWLIRARRGSLRGVLSDRYARLDNAALLGCLEPLLDPRYQVGWFALSDESFHLRLVDPGQSQNVLPNDRLMVGVHLSNSEVGKRAVTVDALVYRLICTNGLIKLINGRSLLHQRHIYLAKPRFEAALAQAISEAMAAAAGFIEQLSWSTREPVKDVAAAITSLARQWELSLAVQELVKAALLGESSSQQETLYGLVNALTNAAQHLSLDERYRLEALAGSLVGGAGRGAAGNGEYLGNSDNATDES